MSTLANFRDDVYALTQELQKKTDYTKDRINHYLNRAYYDFVRRTGCIEDVINVTSVANQVEYSKSDAANIEFIYKINHVRWIKSGVTEMGDILLPYPGGYGNLPDDYQYGTPDWYWTRGMHGGTESANAKKIGVFPVDGSSGNTIRLYVYRFPTSLMSSDGDEPEIPEAYRDALAYGAAWRMFKNYSHENPAWRNKEIMLRNDFMEMVKDYNVNRAEENADNNNVVLDVYCD